MKVKNYTHAILRSLLLCLFLGNFAVSAGANLKGSFGDFDYSFSGMYKPETFYGKNVSLLNNDILSDKILFVRHTLDFNFDSIYGQQKYSTPAVEFYFTVRNRAIWGNPRGIAFTTESESKVLETVGRPHNHAIPRMIFWMREIWMNVELNPILNLDFENQHNFKMGAFPFQLGRGIALGDAYAVGPDMFGFFSDSYVDQYAFGFNWYGDLIKDRLTYDLYTAILQNKTSTLGDNNEKIFGQQYGRITTPARGFGSMNFVVAGRVTGTLFNNESWGKATIEPYAMYNRDPEQTIDFAADSMSNLGTLGAAVEYYGSRFELGFDCAFNVGQQRVKGWDFNQIVQENRDGLAIIVNSKVVDQRGKKVPYTGPASTAQKLINCEFQDKTRNGQVIATIPNCKIGCVSNGDVIGTNNPVNNQVSALVDPIQLTNAKDRFRNPYTNQYEGWMFVADGLVWLYKKDLQCAATVGIASGDDDPNLDIIDGTFSGFVSLQEAYFGKRVKSAFLLGGSGKVKRPLSRQPSNLVASEQKFATAISGFTNIVFMGTGITWAPKDVCRNYAINPNLLVFWQEFASRKFDFKTNKELDERASNFLGAELNLFAHMFVLDSLKLYCITSGFFPGQHFVDIRGKPLNSEQAAIFDRLDTTGFDLDKIPNISNDVAYTVNVGFEFRF